MQANMKMMQERSKRKILRLLHEDAIRFRNGKFMYKEDNSPLTGIYYKKKYWADLGIEDSTDIYGDDYNQADDLEGEVETGNPAQEASTQKRVVEPLEPQQETVKVEDVVQERSGIKINF